MAIQATGRATFTAVEDYDIVFALNGIRCDSLNFDSVRTAENAVLEADFFNGGESCVVDKAILCCYDGEGTVLGTAIEVHDTSTAVADGGNLYLSKDCTTITCDMYVGDKKLCSKSLPVIRNGSSVGVKAVSYKVINNVVAGASLNWDGVQSQTTYPTQKPDKGKYCYVMTIVLYTDGTSTNTVSTSYTPNDGNNGTSVKVTSTKVEYAGGDSGTTPPTSGWQTAVPQLAQGKYLWTRTTVAYSDGNSTKSYSVGRIGMDGSKGGTTHILYASSASPQSKDDVRTTIDAGHQYYGTYQDTNINDDVNKYTEVGSWLLIKGDKGDKGIPGSNGTNGKTSYLHIAYANSADGKIGFDVSNSTGKLYIGQYVDFVETDSTDPTKYAWTRIKGEQGIQGPKGDTGAAGKDGKDGKDGIDGVGTPGVSYRLVPMSDCSATVKASDSSTNATFTLHYTLHYKAVKMVGNKAENATIATIAAVIEDKAVATTVNNTEGALSGKGSKSYNSTDRPADNIPVTVTLSDGTVLYDNVPVTIEAGVAIDINKNLATITKTLANQSGTINTIKSTAESNKAAIRSHDGRLSTVEQKADSISLKVGSMATGKNMWINGAFDMAEDIRPYIWTNDCYYSINTDGDDYPLGFDHRVQFTVSNVGSGIYFEIGDYAGGHKAQSALKLQKEQGYCLSFWAKTGGITSLKAQIGIEGIYTPYLLITDKWARYSVYFNNTLDMTNAQTVLFYSAQAASGALLLLTGIQFEAGTKEQGAPSVWSRSQAELGETGIDITTGKITMKADNFFVRNNSGKETAAVDKDGNLQARSLTCADQANSIIMTVANGYFSVLKGKAGVKIGLDSNGIPCLIGTNPNGDTIWSLGQTFDSNALDSKITFTVSSISAEGLDKSSGSLDIIGRYISIVFNVTNKSTSPITIDSTNLYVVVTDEYGVYTVIYDSSTNVAIGSTESLTVMGTAVSKFSAVMASPAGTGVTVDLYYQKKQRLETSTTYKEDTKGKLVIDNSTGEWTYSRPFII